jgi:protein transport protein SEC61 subunit gamma and related proteins
MAKEFIDKCVRVLKVTKKPNRKEYSAVAKVSAIGILVIGLLGFSIFIIQQLVI